MVGPPRVGHREHGPESPLAQCRAAQNFSSARASARSSRSHLAHRTAALRAFSLATCITECNALARFRLLPLCGGIRLEEAAHQSTKRAPSTLPPPFTACRSL